MAYAGEGFLKVPLTTDHEAVKQEIASLNPNELSAGTAIGEGLAVAVNHLKDSKAKSKIIILMTDGVQTIKIVWSLLLLQNWLQIIILRFTPSESEQMVMH